MLCNAITSNSKIQDAFAFVTCLIGKSIIPIIVALGVAMFVWGVVNYFILGADEEAKRSQGKQFIVWGVVALAAIFSIWGLVRILGGTFSFNTTVLPGTRPSGSEINPNIPPPPPNPPSPYNPPCNPEVELDCMGF